jgi:hypothetical protein
LEIPIEVVEVLKGSVYVSVSQNLASFCEAAIEKVSVHVLHCSGANVMFGMQKGPAASE